MADSKKSIVAVRFRLNGVAIELSTLIDWDDTDPDIVALDDILQKYIPYKFIITSWKKL